MTQIAAVERIENMRRAETSRAGNAICDYPGATVFTVVRLF